MTNGRLKTNAAVATLLLAAVILSVGLKTARGQNVSELQAKIANTNQQIEALEREIKQYKKQIQEAGSKATSLKDALNQLELTRKKLLADLNLTQEKLKVTQLTIAELRDQIAETRTKIDRNQEAMSRAIREVNQADGLHLFEILLTKGTLSGFWNEIDSLHTVRNSISGYTEELEELTLDLIAKEAASEKQEKALVALQSELSDRKTIVEKNKSDTNKVLTETKNSEANYKKLLAEREALRAAFEQELLNYESQLRIAIDLGRLPAVGSAPLAFPLDNIRITQYFGNTAFARANPQVYSGQGHNGVDFGAPQGTPVKSSADGEVVGTGDTDTACPGASYGRWVLIEHGNGLSTLYAHLSVIKASKGQKISSGELLGYSGNTGYSTGPHLHFTVYATQGVRVVERPSKVCKANYILPVADFKAYLNPLSYLPKI